MGHEYFKRPVRSVFGASTVESITVSSAATVQGALAVTGAVTLTTGVSAKTVTGTSNVVANKGFKEGAFETRSTLAQLVLQTYGVSLIDASTAGTSATRAFTLGPPPAAGVRKTIIIKQNTSSTRVISVATTADHYNSTRNSFQTVASKARIVGQPLVIELIGVSTAVWAVTAYPGPALVSSTIGASSWFTYT